MSTAEPDLGSPVPRVLILVDLDNLLGGATIPPAAISARPARRAFAGKTAAARCMVEWVVACGSIRHAARQDTRWRDPLPLLAAWTNALAVRHGIAPAHARPRLTLVPDVPQAADRILLRLLAATPDEETRGPFTHLEALTQDAGLLTAIRRRLNPPNTATRWIEDGRALVPGIETRRTRDPLVAWRLRDPSRPWRRELAPRPDEQHDASPPHPPFPRLDTPEALSAHASHDHDLNWLRDPVGTAEILQRFPGLSGQGSVTATSLHGLSRQGLRERPFADVRPAEAVEVADWSGRVHEAVIFGGECTTARAAPFGEGGVRIDHPSSSRESPRGLTVGVRLPRAWALRALEGTTARVRLELPAHPEAVRERLVYAWMRPDQEALLAAAHAVTSAPCEAEARVFATRAGRSLEWSFPIPAGADPGLPALWPWRAHTPAATRAVLEGLVATPIVRHQGKARFAVRAVVHPTRIGLALAAEAPPDEEELRMPRDLRRGRICVVATSRGDALGLCVQRALRSGDVVRARPLQNLPEDDGRPWGRAFRPRRASDADALDELQWHPILALVPC